MCAEIPVDTKISRNYHCSVLTRRYTVWPNSALDACLDKAVSYQCYHQITTVLYLSWIQVLLDCTEFDAFDPILNQAFIVCHATLQHDVMVSHQSYMSINCGLALS